MESVTMDEITDFAMRNGHTLTDMPMRCGKRLGDSTKEDVLKETAIAKRLGHIYSKRADGRPIRTTHTKSRRAITLRSGSYSLPAPSFS